jgi:hypothetical protein
LLDRRLEQIDPFIYCTQGQSLVRLLGHQRVCGIEIGDRARLIAASQFELGARHERAGIVGLELDRAIEIGHREFTSPHLPVDHRTLVAILRIVGRKLAGSIQIGECSLEIAPRRAGLSAAAQIGGITPIGSLRRWRSGGSAGRRRTRTRHLGRGSRSRRLVRCSLRARPGGRLGVLCAGKIEDRTTVVSEIELVLTVGHVDSVREKKIRPDQHVRIRKIQIPDTQPGILDLFLTEFEARERRDVRRVSFLADTVRHPSGLDPGESGLTPARCAACSDRSDVQAPVSNMTRISLPLTNAEPMV